MLFTALQQFGSGSLTPRAGVSSPQALDTPWCHWADRRGCVSWADLPRSAPGARGPHLARIHHLGKRSIKTFQTQQMCYFQLNFVLPANC